MKDYVQGLKSGIPIALGYLSVSFTFGIMAASFGFRWWQALLISMTTLTSAGQLAGIEIMTLPSRFAEMLITQATINMRYAFMSVSLSQHTSKGFNRIKRLLLGFFITDEIFAVAVTKERVTPVFFLGISTLPYFGWASGTLAGSLVGNVLPKTLMDALCLAMYCMFIAIIVPKIKGSLAFAAVAAIAVTVRVLFSYVPFLKSVPSGFAISIAAVTAAGLGALLFPKKENEEREAAQ